MLATRDPVRAVTVRIADLAVATAPARLVTSGLGSCIAIVLHDGIARVGGLAHVLLPAAGTNVTGSPAKYVATAVPALVTRMRDVGATDALRARLVGGARMFGTLLPPNAPAVGERNVDAARHALAQHGIEIVAEDIGGDFGRHVELDVATGGVLVRSFAREPLAL
ncbi:MAG: chemotaxis protein CheD [Gemmatimonadaceae bacterium]|jgi:chemotaxis protein CheD|nr:chemotaxis protein CheD [Gemmatimonadaceae bacterium]